MKQKITTIVLTLVFSFFNFFQAFAQYEFEAIEEVSCSQIKNQNKTGTCWSFATASFLESEVMRMGKGNVNLSEMFVVRGIYKEKAKNYVLRQGKANFSQGSLAHDLLNITAKYGLVPETVYPGKAESDIHNHTELENVLKGFLDGLLKTKRLSNKWPAAFESIIDHYLGPLESSFYHDGKKMDAKSFADAMGIDPANYVHLTSFTHHPFDSKFILEIPDNFSNGSFENIPIDKLLKILNKALDKGFTVAWDGDVSEKGFSSKEGIAVLPVDEKREDLFSTPGEEIEVNQYNRQEHFESYSTTDDHLMHIVGKSKDQDGTIYYKIKNSWGTIGPYLGYLYMSEAYFKMKTVSITLHKDAL